jgi:hypothetical protein
MLYSILNISIYFFFQNHNFFLNHHHLNHLFGNLRHSNYQYFIGNLSYHDQFNQILGHINFIHLFNLKILKRMIYMCYLINLNYY